VTRIRYKQIAHDLRTLIQSGELAAGQVLPSEATLGERHKASRVTVRRALETLRTEGLVESRQGFGWSVAAETVAQPLDDLVTIEQQLKSTGRRSERQIIDFRYVAAPQSVGCDLGPTVLEVRRLNLADDRPFARVTVWCREDLAAPLSKDEVGRHSFLDLIGGQAAGATQRIGAEPMSETDAELLGVPPGSPALVVRRVTHNNERDPIMASEHVFPGHLTEFLAELPSSVISNAGSAAGLRLVADDRES